VWPVALSGRLPVVALVGRYPTNKLIGREPIPSRNPFHHDRCLKWSYLVLIPVSRSYPRARGRLLTCYSPVRRSSTPKGLSARLACVKHAASVRPEPGSNSPLNVYKQTAGQPSRVSTKRNVSIRECLTNPAPKDQISSAILTYKSVDKAAPKKGTTPSTGVCA
jgi:hypothetical protein